MHTISLIKSYKIPYVISTTTIDIWLQTISSDSNPNHQAIHDCRNDIPNKNAYKEKMVCACPHCTFYRKAEKKNILSLSEYLFIDLDKLGQVDIPTLKVSLASIEFVKAVWLSASSTGIGLLCPIKGLTVANFKETMNALHEYFIGIGLPPDPHCKPLSARNCLSYDPDVIIKDDFIPFNSVENKRVSFAYKREEEEKNITSLTIPFAEHPLQTACRLAGELLPPRMILILRRLKTFLMVHLCMSILKVRNGIEFTFPSGYLKV